MQEGLEVGWVLQLTQSNHVYWERRYCKNLKAMLSVKTAKLQPVAQMKQTVEGKLKQFYPFTYQIRLFPLHSLWAAICLGLVYSRHVSVLHVIVMRAESFQLFVLNLKLAPIMLVHSFCFCDLDEVPDNCLATLQPPWRRWGNWNFETMKERICKLAQLEERRPLTS